METHVQKWNNGNSWPRHRMTSRAQNATSWIMYIVGVSITPTTLDTPKHISKINFLLFELEESWDFFNIGLECLSRI